MDLILDLVVFFGSCWYHLFLVPNMLILSLSFFLRDNECVLNIDEAFPLEDITVHIPLEYKCLSEWSVRPNSSVIYSIINL